ncbi:MAG: anti-sigma factor [Longimicrobiales bacterium]
MNRGCEFYTDALVELTRGALDTDRAVRVEAHLATCDDCRGALDAIRAVQAARAPVPEGLEARIQAAVRKRIVEAASAEGEPSTIDVKRRPSWSGWRAWMLPVAAAAGLALWIGTSDLLSPVGDPAKDAAEVVVDEYDPYGAWPATDGVVAGDLVLSELSVQELEALLEEMER